MMFRKGILKALTNTPTDTRCRNLAARTAEAIGPGIEVQRAYTPAEDQTLCVIEFGTSPEDFFTCKLWMTGDEAKNRDELMRQVKQHLKDLTATQQSVEGANEN